MPRTIDSLSPKQEDSQPTRKNGLDASSAKSVEDLRGTTLREDKAAHFKRKKVSRRPSPQRLVVIALLVVAVLSVAAVIWYWPGLNGGSGTAAVKDTKQNLGKLDVVKDLSDADKDSLYEKVGPEYYAAQQAGFAPDFANSDDQEMIKYLALGKKDSASVSTAIEGFIAKRLEQVEQDGYKEGYLYSFWFGNTAIQLPANFDVPGRGDAQALASDKAYAADKAAQAKQRLQAGSIAPDQLIKEISNDPKLRMYEDPNGSTRLSPPLNSTAASTGTYKVVADTLASMQSAGFSELKTRNYVSVYDASRTPVEAGYFFIQLTKVVKGDAAVAAYQDNLKKMEALQW